MSAIKYGEKNVKKGKAPENPGDWDKTNQGKRRAGPGQQAHDGRDKDPTVKVPEDQKSYLLKR
jgi:hypothetical protein